MRPSVSSLRLLLLAVAGLALAGCSSSTASLSPLEWHKVPGDALNGAILGLDPTPGSFDERANFTVSAIRDGATIRLYYGGSDTTDTLATGCGGTTINVTHWRIGMAQSNDGVHFTRVPGAQTGASMVDNGGTTAFDSFITYRPFVLKDGTTYRMWFNGSTMPFKDCTTNTLADNRRIGYAESSDGIAWEKHYDGAGPSGSVLPLGGAGAIDAQQVGYVWVIKDGAEYKMYYSANDATNTWRVALATSSDARTWTKHPGKQTGGSILDTGPAGAFDHFCAYQPSVYKERDQLYRMWYRGCATQGNPPGPSAGTIGYAESNDGITWVKIPQPTAVGDAVQRGPVGSFDSGGLTTPSVLFDGMTWSMYYAGVDTHGQFLSGLAQAANP